MCDITDLKKNPMFNLSLSSKELFHSNFLAWIAEDEDTKDLFVEILKLFGLQEDIAMDCAKGIRDGHYIVKREYNNFDFCICEKIRVVDTNSKETYIPGQVILVLENKFKSIPYEKQLEKYQEDVANKLNINGWRNAVKAKNNTTRWNKKCADPNNEKLKRKCHFVLLSLAKDVCGLEIKQEEKRRFVEVANTNQTSTQSSTPNTTKWTFVTYREYSAALLKNRIKIVKKNGYVEDYATYVSQFCEYLENNIPDVIDNSRWTGILSSKKELVDIRMDDIWQKLVANIIASHYAHNKSNVEFGYDCVTILGNDDEKYYVDTGFSNGTASFEVKVKIDNDCLFGIQIQNGHYRRLLQTTKEKPTKDFKNKTKQLSVLFDNDSSWSDARIWEGDVYPKANSKKDFCSYGEDFIYKYKKLSDECTVKDVLDAIDKDINDVKLVLVR